MNSSCRHQYHISIKNF